MQKPEYKQAAGISQSAIKRFRSMPLIKFKEQFIDRISSKESVSESLTFGSLTDTLAFEPELVNDLFYIPPYDVEFPGDKLKAVMDASYEKIAEIVNNKRLLNNQGMLPEEIYIPDIYEMGEFKNTFVDVARELKYGGGKWSANTIYDNCAGAYRYYSTLVEAAGREVVSFVDSANANQMVNNLKTNPSTISYFVQQPGETLIFQQEIYEEYDYEGIKVPLKCAVDIIRLVHKEKTVYIPDLKTTYDVREFRDQAIKYGYLDQVSFYRYMVGKWLQTFKGGAYKDYVIANLFDIVIDPIVKVPYIFEFDAEDLDIIEHGSKVKNIKGWRNTLDEICWHIKNNVWTIPKELFENGKIKLKFFHDQERG